MQSLLREDHAIDAQHKRSALLQQHTAAVMKYTFSRISEMTHIHVNTCTHTHKVLQQHTARAFFALSYSLWGIFLLTVYCWTLWSGGKKTAIKRILYPGACLRQQINVVITTSKMFSVWLCVACVCICAYACACISVCVCVCVACVCVCVACGACNCSSLYLRYLVWINVGVCLFRPVTLSAKRPFPTHPLRTCFARVCP